MYRGVHLRELGSPVFQLADFRLFSVALAMFFVCFGYTCTAVFFNFVF